MSFNSGVQKVKHRLVMAVVIIILRDAGEVNKKFKLEGGQCFHEFCFYFRIGWRRAHSASAPAPCINEDQCKKPFDDQRLSKAVVTIFIYFVHVFTSKI
jgi:hypothetical protein